MNSVRTIDTHTHILTPETAKLLSKAAPKLNIAITPIDDNFAKLQAGDIVYPDFPTGGFDVTRRLKDMDDTDVDVQVLSVTPTTYLYGQEATLRRNLHHPERPIGQTHRRASDAFHGHRHAADAGARARRRRAQARHDQVRPARRHVCSNIAGKNLDDPSFEPLWATAEELGAFMFIHPYTVAGADRLKSFYLGNLIGNPLDTTIAAACLIFGGVMHRHPKLKVVLAHGGGFTPYQGGALEHGWAVRTETKKYLKEAADRHHRQVLLRHNLALGQKRSRP